MEDLQNLRTALLAATNNGVLDRLTSYLHPDRINEFCDAVAEMADEEDKENCSHEAATQCGESWYCPNCSQYIEWPQEDG